MDADQTNREELVPPETFLKAIHGSYGIKGSIARSLGVSLNFVNAYLNSNPSIGEHYLQEFERRIDLGETALMSLVENPEANDHFNAIKFLLAKQGHPRGWGDTPAPPPLKPVMWDAKPSKKSMLDFIRKA